MLVAALDAAGARSIEWHEQLGDGAGEGDITYAEKITREDRLLRPRTTTAQQLERTIRALNPHIGALLETTDGQPLRIEAAAITARALDPGAVEASGGRLFVGTPRDALELLRVRPAGGRSMDVESFLRGNDVPQIVG